MNLQTTEYLQKIDQLEEVMLKIPQADCPVTHHFGPGVYIREVFLPAGSFAIGHYQKTEHLNSFVKGRVLMVGDDGLITEMAAPCVYVSKPGRKVGYILEDVVWQNIYATDERDIEKLESIYLEKSSAWEKANDSIKLLQNKINNDDYYAAITELGFTHDIVIAQSINEDDQTPFPSGSYKVQVADSMISGKGLFATGAFERGDIICPARIAGKRTPAGRYTNHSHDPNAVMIVGDNKTIYLAALKPIKGNSGGYLGDEITINYRDSVNLVKTIGGSTT